MGFYINRIKYKGGSPRLGALSGIINNAVINGYYFYDDDYSPINYVTELKMSNPRSVKGGSTSNYANLNTGITLTQNLKWRVVFTTYKQDGGYVFGATGSGSSTYRVFTYDNQLFFDIGSSRIGTGWGIEGMPVVFNGTSVYDVTFNNFYYTNNDSGVTYNPGGSATSTVNSNFYVCLDPIGLRALQIYDSTGTSLVFDGWPALDGNNQPCLYDKISGTYKYFTVPSGSSSGYVTYKSLTPCIVTLSTNDDIMGNANGAGTYYVGDSVSISASSNTGYRFVGWYDGNTLISSIASYSFVIFGNVSYEARFEVASSSYTLVKYIYLTTPNTDKTVWVDTGIKSGNNLELRTQCYITQQNGNMYVGHAGGSTPRINSDNNDYRWFYYSSQFYLDVGSGRVHGGSAILNQDIDISMIVNGSSARIVNNLTSSQIISMTWSGTINNYDIFILLNSMKFTSLVITNTDNVVLFNGHAAIDSSNVPCVYDSITDNLIYPYRYSQTSGTVVLYEPY